MRLEVESSRALVLAPRDPRGFLLDDDELAFGGDEVCRVGHLVGRGRADAESQHQKGKKLKEREIEGLFQTEILYEGFKK